MRIRTEFLTAGWKAKAAEVQAALEALRPVLPADETCDVIVGETRGDAAIEAVVIRLSRTMVWSDCTSEDVPGGAGYRYRKVFGPEDPTMQDIVESVRRILTAPAVG